jgi:hypothetical protein
MPNNLANFIIQGLLGSNRWLWLCFLAPLVIMACTAHVYARPPQQVPTTLLPFTLSTPAQQPYYAGPPGNMLPYPQTTWPGANPFPMNQAPAYPAEETIVRQCEATPTSLWGLESQRFFRSSLCPSPDGQWQAYTEMTFVPALRQTTATLYIIPLLPNPQPVPQPPRARTWREAHLWDKLEPRIYPDLFPPPPPIHYAERNQTPSYYMQRAIPLLKLTFQPPFEFSTLQVEAWDGNHLWVVQKTGRLHVGWQTLRRWHIDVARQTIHSTRLN